MGNLMPQLLNKTTAIKDKTPLITFGILTDIQYCDIDDCENEITKKMRYYRNSLDLIGKAIVDWKQMELDENINFKFILQLGDLIDGKCKLKNESVKSMDLVLNELNKMFSKTDDKNVLSVWGNHEMYNFSRTYLSKTKLNTAKLFNNENNGNYYSVDLTDKIKLVCLDLYEYSALGYKSNNPVYKKALNTLRSHNKNKNLNSSLGLDKNLACFCLFNGTIGIAQFIWLESQLNEAYQNKIKVILCGHIPLHYKSAKSTLVAWNSKEILNLIYSFKNVVIAYIAGHYHQGGYYLDHNNIHHFTIPAVLETHPNSNSYCTIKIYENKINVFNFSTSSSIDINFS